MDKILILDFGSQYTQLIARKIRELSVYCEIRPFNICLDEIKEYDPKALILSGGPASSLSDDAPKISEEVLKLGKPTLGICYGMQLVTLMRGGKVVHKSHSQYGPATISTLENGTLFKDVQTTTDVWMSHGDSITELPKGFKKIATATEKSGTVIAAFENIESKIWGVQFHPEVHHTKDGKQILSNFLALAEVSQDFKMSSFLESKIKELKETLGDSKVVCGVSGGVDSSVAATLLNHAVGKNLTCVFVNNGVLRKNEAAEVLEIYKELGLNVIYNDATELFLGRLKGVTDPETKRKIIGKAFIEIFEEEKNKLQGIEYLGQGTTYPDVIESVSFKGPSVTIKSHHNVGGLPKKMNLKLVEPLRELFKDEVRALGRELKIPNKTLNRHPFPGPGLAIRILGEVSPENVQILQDADAIVREEIENDGLYDEIWQLGTMLLPVRTVGVMGDERSYEKVAAVRAVTSVDGMTADWAEIPAKTLGRISNRIINEVRGINRVVYDISSKPPATIEWE